MANVIQHREDGFDQVGEALITGQGQSVVLDFPPQPLDQVQLGRVGGQVMQHDPLRGPVVQPLLDRSAGVPRRVVENDHAGLGVATPGREAIDGLGDLTAGDFAWHGVEERPIVPGQEAEDVEPLGREGWKFNDGADGLPGIGHRGHAAKARTVEVEQLHPSGIREALQGLLVVLLAGEGVLIAAAFQQTAAAVPGVAELFLRRGAASAGRRSCRLQPPGRPERP